MIEQLFYINHSPFFERLMQDFAYLRLGNVLLVFGFFALMRNVITSQLIKTIGQKHPIDLRYTLLYHIW
ncbi:Uncharacterised protein [Capnocytophaga ochracea]|uniref:Uncharacterized protein n=1 Tax=Capnocytophaga ochracea TaxID=1018 RepID=A0A2X1H2L3_CAPOC|nr:Uncharacterised protein [Capnocytophaga ochracea]